MTETGARSATANVVKAPGEGGVDHQPPSNHQHHRIRSEPMDALIGRTFDVLDHGFVRVVDYMGDDSSIVQAARLSYGTGTKTVSEDRDLIRYLMRQRHTTPFEMCEIKLHVSMPMDVWRQWIRHRTASVNEYSTRYSEAIDHAAKTEPTAWRKQSTTNKQGSGSGIPEDVGAFLTDREDAFQKFAREIYQERLSHDVAREQARKDLPLSTYTEAYWKVDLHNLLHFLNLRLDPHAQLEIRRFAEVIATICQAWVPTVWQAFRDYRLDAMQLSGLELRALESVILNLTKHLSDPRVFPADNGLCAGMSKREITEFVAKLDRLGFRNR